PAAHDNQRTLIPRFLEISLVFPRRPSHDVRITPLRDLSVKRGNKNSNSLHAIWGCSLWYRNNGVPETKRAGKTTEAGSYHKLLVLYSRDENMLHHERDPLRPPPNNNAGRWQWRRGAVAVEFQPTSAGAGAFDEPVHRARHALNVSGFQTGCGHVHR